MAAADADPSTYDTTPTMAGLTHIFTAPREACDACAYGADHSTAEAGPVIATSTSPITPMLRDYIQIGELEGLALEQVVPFLTKKLYWRVVGINLQPYDPAHVNALKISVSSTVSVYRPDSSIPAQSAAHKHPEVSAGRVSGDPATT